ncbi:MAG: ROK family protein, partial [Bacteroidota bacterium]
MVKWGIDLGGTKIEAVVLDGQAKVLCRKRIDTEADGGYEHIIHRINLLVEEVTKEFGTPPQRVGIGTPGTMDPITNTMKNSNTTALNGKPFQQDLSKKLGIPVVMANDANCFALAEARMGIVQEKMPEASMVFGVIMGTGVGGGLVIDGKVWNGRQGIAGEWGHNFLDESGGPCYCG